MRDQSVFGESTRQWRIDGLTISPEDRLVLRELAQKVLELSKRPVEQEKKKLWLKHNKLEATRPLIFCDPENGWNEILPPESFRCTGELAQTWENALRKEIFWGERMGDDRVIESYFNVYYSYVDTGWGMKEVQVKNAENGSYTWLPAFKDYGDLDRLKFPQIVVDYETTAKIKELAENTLGDILRVRLKGQWWWSIGLTYVVINMRGLEQFMMDMYDYPDELHRLMAFLRDGFLEKIDFLEENGLLSLNNDETYVGSGGFGYTDELPSADFAGKVRAKDIWGFLESQETVSVSPAMFEEFVYAYQLPILEKFGLNCYGCCEPLDRRWHVMEKAPNLRRVSVSPWANLNSMAEKLGGKFIYSMKVKPSPLAEPKLDEDAMRAQMREAFRITRDNRVEAIMKDNHTLGGNPENAVRWCAIAREEAEAL
jgi:hypothetical protein